MLLNIHGSRNYFTVFFFRSPTLINECDHEGVIYLKMTKFKNSNGIALKRREK